MFLLVSTYPSNIWGGDLQASVWPILKIESLHEPVLQQLGEAQTPTYSRGITFYKFIDPGGVMSSCATHHGSRDKGVMPVAYLLDPETSLSRMKI